MIEDILFEKLEFPASSNFSMSLKPSTHSPLRSAKGKGGLSQAGILATHTFSASNQPLSASDVKHVRALQNESKKRCVLFKNPFLHKATAKPMTNRYGSFSGGALIRPQGAVHWQPVQYFATNNLDKVGFRPVAYAENITTDNGTPITYDFVTKQCSLGTEQAPSSTSLVEFVNFDFWLACKITQFEAVPIRERKLNLSCNGDAEYLCAITLEEDAKVSLPVFFSWPSAEEVSRTTSTGITEL